MSLGRNHQEIKPCVLICSITVAKHNEQDTLESV